MLLEGTKSVLEGIEHQHGQLGFVSVALWFGNGLLCRAVCVLASFPDHALTKAAVRNCGEWRTTTQQICLTLPTLLFKFLLKYTDVLEMVHSQEVSSAFAALGDPTRLAILSRLADQGELTVQEIAQPFAMSLPAVSQHLKVLEHAGLILRRRDGQRRPCQIRPEGLAEAMTWLNFTRRAWEARFDRLARFLHDTSQPNGPKGTNHDPEK